MIEPKIVTARIPISSKSRRTYKEVGSNKRRPRNLAAWKRVVGFKVRGMQAHAHDLHYRNGRVRRREAGEWTSRRPRNLAAGCSDLKLNLAAARFRGNTVFADLNSIRIILYASRKFGGF